MYRLRYILLLVFVFGPRKIGGNADTYYDSEGSSETIVGDHFPLAEVTKALGAVNAMVEESGAIVRNRMLGRKMPEAARYFNERLIRDCLRKFRTRNEKIESAAKCLAEALGNAQGQQESVEEGRVPAMQTCLRETTVKAVAETGTLMMEALNRTRGLRELLQQAGERLANCVRQPKPFECAKGTWAEVGESAMNIPESVKDAMLTIREAYTNYMDDIRLCMTPVEERDTPSPFPSSSAVENSKIYATTAPSPTLQPRERGKMSASKKQLLDLLCC